MLRILILTAVVLGPAASAGAQANGSTITVDTGLAGAAIELAETGTELLSALEATGKPRVGFESSNKLLSEAYLTGGKWELESYIK